MDVIFDTNLVLDFVRGGKISEDVIEKFELDTHFSTIAISAVTIGEMYSLALQRNWGQTKVQQFARALQNFLVIPVNSKDMFLAYSQIDAFSKGKLKNQPLPNSLSARNMGKNDLWIAAAACVTNTTLITTDKDFTHLDKTFLKLEWVNIETYRSIL